MKYTQLFLALFLIWALRAGAQNVRVVSNEAVTSEADGSYYSPQMDKSGNRIFFTTSGYKGLYFYDLHSAQIKRVSDAFGAGYEPALKEDGRAVVYRTYVLKNGRRFYSIENANVRSGEKTVLQKEVRALSTPRLFPDGTIAYSLHSQLKKDNRLAPAAQKQISAAETAVFIENRQIVLYKNNRKHILEPRGPGSYIWPELSPSGTYLLFKKLGDGCYVSDLQGNIISSLGNLNAPHWSPDGKFIVYMKDKDDGSRILSSEIHIIQADGSKDIPLTFTEDKIELYPRWGNDSDTIIYNTEKGQIYLMRLEWK